MTEQTAQGMKNEMGSKAKSRWRAPDFITPMLGPIKEEERNMKWELSHT